ncbi:TPA: hypothetical protein JAV82_002334 [Kluyvera ascorbata]|nr:hypothetical protein [Kluyvera ascorbata]
MKTYAFIQNGEVAEIIQPATWPDGTEIDIKDRFAPAFVAQMVDITDLDQQPGIHWRYSGGEFTPPELNEIIPPQES